MANTLTVPLAAALPVLFAAAASEQQAPPLTPGVVGPCFSALMNLSDCLSFVEEGSNLTAPAKPCCPELAGLVDRNLTCLCELLARADSFRVKIDVHKMLQLPPACDISTPPATLCADIGVPVEVPGADGESLAPAASNLTSPSESGSWTNSGGVLATGLSALAVVVGLRYLQLF